MLETEDPGPSGSPQTLIERAASTRVRRSLSRATHSSQSLLLVEETADLTKGQLWKTLRPKRSEFPTAATTNFIISKTKSKNQTLSLAPIDIHIAVDRARRKAKMKAEGRGMKQNYWFILYPSSDDWIWFTISSIAGMYSPSVETWIVGTSNCGSA